MLGRLVHGGTVMGNLAGRWPAGAVPFCADPGAGGAAR